MEKKKENQKKKLPFNSFLIYIFSFYWNMVHLQCYIRNLLFILNCFFHLFSIHFIYLELAQVVMLLTHRQATRVFLDISEF